MAPLVPPNRPIGRAGVNACRSLFERCGYIFQEVELGNDFGKDAYVDLVDGREVTGACIALQIKSGESFRRRDGYSIPIDDHYSVWRQSSIPVAGIVYDPAEDRLYWCNISEHLELAAGDAPNSITIGKDQFLDETTLEKGSSGRWPSGSTGGRWPQASSNSAQSRRSSRSRRSTIASVRVVPSPASSSC